MKLTLNAFLSATSFTRWQNVNMASDQLLTLGRAKNEKRRRVSKEKESGVMLADVVKLPEGARDIATTVELLEYKYLG